MPFGYNGKILHVDLTQQEWRVIGSRLTAISTGIGINLL